MPDRKIIMKIGFTASPDFDVEKFQAFIDKTKANHSNGKFIMDWPHIVGYMLDNDFDDRYTDFVVEAG